MPYVITTTTPGYYCMHCGPGACTTDSHSLVSRVAVATLEDARKHCLEETVRTHAWGYGSQPFISASRALPESGGTIGPLPDGTIIEVRRVDNFALGMEAGLLPVDHPSMWPVADLVSRFNAS